MSAAPVYEVQLEKQAQRDLDRLPDEVSKRAIRAMRALATNPRPHGCRKIVGSAGDWRIRVGDYRIIYEVADAAKTVRVMYIRHRRETYR